uniref:Uncharacterized protein n=1 Tax=Eutreptiella gymnastica TaxID=73025 RepID=A0A7S1ILU2_9EUGL|mmetsp:Transcript_27078/g.48831  ORF Transcript_27078/g.48831 Transcript_27078/m.48831 type:complete len:106 (+) Transcript_27078:139-456(+)
MISVTSQLGEMNSTFSAQCYMQCLVHTHACTTSAICSEDAVHNHSSSQELLSSPTNHSFSSLIPRGKAWNRPPPPPPPPPLPVFFAGAPPPPPPLPKCRLQSEPT